METNVVPVNLDENRVDRVLKEAVQNLHSAEGEMILDFSPARRIGTGELRALEEFVLRANEKTVKVALRGVNVNVYKVLKLAKLAQRFTFVG